MAYSSMREFLDVLDQQHKLFRVSKAVDRNWEPACLAKWMYQALPEHDRVGLFFENVIGTDIPMVTGALGASTETYATALQVEPDEINCKWEHALLNPVRPQVVDRAVCQELVHIGSEAKLNTLPIPVWTPGKDVGPYLTTIVVTRNAALGSQNMAVYRSRVVDDRNIAINLNPGRHGYLSCRSYWDHGKPAPIAWIIAAEPAVHLATVANLPYGSDEINVAGGLKGEPIELVKAKTVDLLVPANAEIVIEAELRPGDMGEEGPFGEFAGYMGPITQKPLAKITAITHRKKPIYYGLTSQMPPSESTVIQSLTNAGVILKTLRHDLSETTVQDVFVDLTFGGLLAHCIVAMTPQYPGHGKRVGRIVADITPLKRVTVVDADVDIRDPLHMDWALNSRFNPVRDTVIIDDVFFPLNMDPSIRTDEGAPGTGGSKMVIDATEKVNSGPFSLPPRDIMMRALALWREVGLPEFKIPKRAQLRVDRS